MVSNLFHCNSKSAENIILRNLVSQNVIGASIMSMESTSVRL